MKVRNFNPKTEKWKYYQNFTTDQVFEKVYCCIIGTTIWYNGRDGFFYTHIKNQKVDDDNTIVRTGVATQARTLEFVTDNMRTGFNMKGIPVCHSKNYFSQYRYPLKAAAIVPK